MPEPILTELRELLETDPAFGLVEARDKADEAIARVRAMRRAKR